MREIKFRQAIKAQGQLPFRWHYWGYIEKYPHDFIAPVGRVDWDDRPSYQFTGLKDKNGKEDYDGNIWEVEYRGKKHKFLHKSELGWEGYIFSFRCLTGEVSPVHANVDEDGEIIGNIHDNPKLLEEKEKC